MPGYFQPVDIRAPEGTHIALAEQGAFQMPQAAPVKVGMLIGAVYRLKVTNIPEAAGLEVFPTVEVIDRLYAPPGQELRFPIPVELTLEDLELALDGKFVTRVIYLEDSQNPLPQAQPGRTQLWFEAAPGQDPLVEADILGRPVAILRMGARLPDRQTGVDAAFLYGCPPVRRWQQVMIEEPQSPKSPSTEPASPEAPPREQTDTTAPKRTVRRMPAPPTIRRRSPSMATSPQRAEVAR